MLQLIENSWEIEEHGLDGIELMEAPVRNIIIIHISSSWRWSNKTSERCCVYVDLVNVVTFMLSDK